MSEEKYSILTSQGGGAKNMKIFLFVLLMAIYCIASASTVVNSQPLADVGNNAVIAGAMEAQSILEYKARMAELQARMELEKQKLEQERIKSCDPSQRCQYLHPENPYDNRLKK